MEIMWNIHEKIYNEDKIKIYFRILNSDLDQSIIASSHLMCIKYLQLAESDEFK